MKDAADPAAGERPNSWQSTDVAASRWPVAGDGFPLRITVLLIPLFCGRSVTDGEKCDRDFTRIKKWENKNFKNEIIYGL